MSLACLIKFGIFENFYEGMDQFYSLGIDMGICNNDMVKYDNDVFYGNYCILWPAI